MGIVFVGRGCLTDPPFGRDPMTRILLKRLLGAFPLLAVISLLCYALLEQLPG